MFTTETFIDYEMFNQFSFDVLSSFGLPWILAQYNIIYYVIIIATFTF